MEIDKTWALLRTMSVLLGVVLLSLFAYIYPEIPEEYLVLALGLLSIFILLMIWGFLGGVNLHIKTSMVTTVCLTASAAYSFIFADINEIMAAAILLNFGFAMFFLAHAGYMRSLIKSFSENQDPKVKK